MHTCDQWACRKARSTGEESLLHGTARRWYSLGVIPHVTPPTWPDAISPGRWASRIRRTPDRCRVALLGLPDDTGVVLNNGRPGARGGPRAFREALAKYGAADSMAGDGPLVFDAGDVDPSRDIHETHDRVTQATESLLAMGLIPVAIGGGHDLTFPFVRAVAARHTPLAGIYFDAHFDVRDTVGSGMPFRKLIETCGVQSLEVHGLRPTVNTREHEEWFLSHGGIVAPDDATPAIDSSLSHCFASFDLDVLDAAFAPGVSAMNPIGWTPKMAESWVFAAGAARNVRCFDIMELNPEHDDRGRTARLAAHIFLTFLRGVATRGEA
jgi:formimidoylglutamase